MRQHKYRYWYSGKMEEVGQIDFFENGTYRVNDELVGGVLMEFTGLKDKNGVEIYEHDVILLKDKDYEEKNETAQALSTYEFHCVEFKYGCFKIGGVNLGDYIDGKYLDIIQCGNIYENKEVYRVEEKILSHGEDMNITDITFNISNKK